MHGIILRKLARAQWLVACFSRLRTADAEPVSVPPDVALITTFKNVVEFLSGIRGRGVGDVNRYAFLSIRELVTVAKKLMDPKSKDKKIRWENDFVPKLKAIAEGKTTPSDVREAANLWIQYFTAMKKHMAILADGSASFFSTKVFTSGRIIAEEAQRLSKQQESKQVQVRYILQPNARGGLAGFDLFNAIPVGHDKAFFKSYKSRDSHFKFFLEDGTKIRRMFPTKEWAADKLGELDFNLGTSGMFKTSLKNNWKTIRVIADESGGPDSGLPLNQIAKQSEPAAAEKNQQAEDKSSKPKAQPIAPKREPKPGEPILPEAFSRAIDLKGEEARARWDSAPPDLKEKIVLWIAEAEKELTRRIESTLTQNVIFKKDTARRDGKGHL